MKVFIRESSLHAIRESVSKYAEKVMMVKNYLDQKFPLKGIAHDGKDTEVAMHSNDDEYAWGYQDIFDDAQKEFKNAFGSSEERDRNLHDIIVAWYYDRISPNGVIMSGLK